MPYAEGTKVPVAQTKGEIEKLVIKRGGDQFLTGWSQSDVHVGFRVEGRMLRFTVPLSTESSERVKRQIWRALLLVIKAKFESVESGIETFDESFLPNIVMHDGSTMGEWAKPQVALMYDKGEMPPLLPAPRR